MAGSRGACVVIGAGDGVGGAIAKAFAAEGLVACVTRRPRNGDQLEGLAQEIRDVGGEARAYGVDAREEADMAALFDRIEAEVGPIEVVVFNIGANVPLGILETDSRKFFKIWEMACFAGFLCGREAARYMSTRQRGTIIFTGATASVRGAAGFAAFASAKHGLRALAQSMARELGPQNIHVAHVIVDAAVDTQWIAENVPESAALKLKDGIVAPDDLAANYTMLYRQPRNAWTFEMDVRPWIERW